MSNYIVTDTELTSIANAVRAKSGGNSSLQFPTGFVSEIQSISAGATEVEEKDVNFIDYDGTILYSYTAQEAQALEALPANPTHTGLTAQGWNWTLAQIKTQLTQVGGKVWVGQMYITSSGDTEIYITLDDSEYLSPYLTFCLEGEISVNWGDNTSSDIITGDSISTSLFYQHTYTQIGNYVIKITVNSGQCSFYNTTEQYDNILCSINQFNNSNRGHIYNSTIQHIRIGNNMYIGMNAFTYCIKLQTITIPSSISFMDGAVFNYCGCLRSVTIPSLVTNFGNYTFRGCYTLQNVAIPPSITYMGSSDFAYCNSLQTLTIPFSVTTTSSQIFNQCRNLRSIIIPSSITTLKNGLFTSCENLQDIKILASSVTIESSVFYNCTSLRNITLPSLNAVAISKQTFGNCYSLIRIIIPTTIMELGSSAFSYCYALHNITIPSSVSSIGIATFADCYGMESYHFQSTTPPSVSATSAFNGIMSSCIIYVPYSADHSVLNAYGTATNWSTYATHLKEEGENGITWAEWQALNA